MSTEENVQIVKKFFAAMGGYNKQALLALVAEDIEWIIPGEDWPLAARTADTRNCRLCFRRRPKRWKRHTQSPPNSWRRETGFWSSASLRGQSKPRIIRSRTTGSSTLPFEIAR
jgi:ketosteroid isomerase-like protein